MQEESLGKMPLVQKLKHAWILYPFIYFSNIIFVGQEKQGSHQEPVAAFWQCFGHRPHSHVIRNAISPSYTMTNRDGIKEPEVPGAHCKVKRSRVRKCICPAIDDSY